MDAIGSGLPIPDRHGQNEGVLTLGRKITYLPARSVDELLPWKWENAAPQGNRPLATRGRQITLTERLRVHARPLAARYGRTPRSPDQRPRPRLGNLMGLHTHAGDWNRDVSAAQRREINLEDSELSSHSCARPNAARRGKLRLSARK